MLRPAAPCPRSRVTKTGGKTLNRPAIKSQARQIIGDNLKTVMTCAALLVLLSAVFSYITGLLLRPMTDELENLYAQMLQGRLVDPNRVYDAVYGQPRELLVSRLLQWLLTIVEFGFMLFLFKIIRKKPASYGNLLDGFAIWWKILLLELLTSVLIALWSLLLVIPGIIAAYRYRMAPFLLLTHPEYGLMDCIRESKARTKGHKLDFFFLDLSFLGWELLTLIPFLGWAVMLWVKPYRQTAELLTCMHFSAAYDRPLWEMEDPRFPN